jgi:ABC-type spermidine/putrescine transport system permease subunit II
MRRPRIRLTPILTAVIALFLVIPTVVVLVASLSQGRQIVFPPNGLTLHW